MRPVLLSEKGKMFKLFDNLHISYWGTVDQTWHSPGLTHALAIDQTNSQCDGVAITYRNYTQYTPSLDRSLILCLMTDWPPLQALEFPTLWLEVTSGSWKVKCTYIPSSHRPTRVILHIKPCHLFGYSGQSLLYGSWFLCMLCTRATVIDCDHQEVTEGLSVLFYFGMSGQRYDGRFTFFELQLHLKKTLLTHSGT